MDRMRRFVRRGLRDAAASLARRAKAMSGAAILAAGLGLCLSAQASAADYPSRLIKLIVPSTAGSPNDTMARLLAQQLSPRLGQTIIIENKPGAGTAIGTRTVVAAEPDGYTLMLTSSAVIVETAVKKLDYDPVKDLTPIATVATTPWLITVAPSLPGNLAAFVGYTRSHPGTTNFAATQGTAAIVVAELFRQVSNADLRIIPYKGGMAAMPDFLGGRIQVYVPTPATVMPYIRSGKMLPLLITSPNRSADLPDVPTARESGLPDLTLEFWAGVFGPAGMPPAITAKVNAAINDTLRSPEMKHAMNDLGFQARIGTPQDFAAFMAHEAARWSEIVKRTGSKFD
jgi:tripartite-type tricarboxylate transporter receptor subunit TctC